MKTLVAVLCVPLALLCSCVTLPDPVKESLLVERNADETKKMADLEQSIITLHKQKQDAKTALDDAVQKAAVSAGRLALIEKERAVLDEREKQYMMEKDAAKLAETRTAIEEKTKEVIRQTLDRDYTKALADDRRALYEMAEAALSVAVAELNFEKAKVARAYQDRQAEKLGKPKKNAFVAFFSPGDEVNPKRYSDYLESQRRILADKTARQKETAEKLAQAERAVKK